MILLIAALACVACHKDIVERWERTPMARSAGPVVAADEPAGTVVHRSATYRVRDGVLSWSDSSVALSYYIGSRRMGRSYVHQRQGHLYQVPVGYYANRKKWDMAPGYESDASPDLRRPITADCLFCHSSGARLSGVNRLESGSLRGIGCERCHGDSQEHGRLVNPARLAAPLRDSVCEQCHLSGVARIVRQDRRLADFRPGVDLSSFLVVFGSGDGGVRVNGHADSLGRSKCKQSGEVLWCGSCHPVHGKADVNAVCQSCHTKPHRPASDCVACHMPKSRAADGGHTVFTNHAIPARSGVQRTFPMRSYYEVKPGAREEGLAYAEAAAKLRRPDLAERAYSLLRAVSNPDAAVLAALGRLLDAAGQPEAAMKAYNGSLELDPLQPDLLARLAALRGERNQPSDDLLSRLARLLP